MAAFKKSVLILASIFFVYFGHYYYMRYKISRDASILGPFGGFTEMLMDFKIDYKDFPSDSEEIKSYLDKYEDYYTSYVWVEYLKENDFNVQNNRQDSIFYIYLDGFNHADDNLKNITYAKDWPLWTHLFKKSDVVLYGWKYNSTNVDIDDFILRRENPLWDGD